MTNRLSCPRPSRGTSPPRHSPQEWLPGARQAQIAGTALDSNRETTTSEAAGLVVGVTHYRCAWSVGGEVLARDADFMEAPPVQGNRARTIIDPRASKAKRPETWGNSSGKSNEARNPCEASPTSAIGGSAPFWPRGLNQGGGDLHGVDGSSSLRRVGQIRSGVRPSSSRTRSRRKTSSSKISMWAQPQPSYTRSASASIRSAFVARKYHVAGLLVFRLDL